VSTHEYALVRHDRTRILGSGKGPDGQRWVPKVQARIIVLITSHELTYIASKF
jgi:hypothetical protein